MSEENRRNEEAEWAEWEETMRVTTPEHRAEVFEICERLQKNAQEGLEALERVPSGSMSAADRMAKSNQLQHALEIAHARMEFLKPYIEVDQARQAEEEALQEEFGSDLEGEYNGFDWTEVEEAVASDSAALDETDVYKNRVNSARAGWEALEIRRPQPAPTVGLQSGASENTSSQPAPTGNESNAEHHAQEEHRRAEHSDRRDTYPASRPIASGIRDSGDSNRSDATRREESSPNMWQRYMPEILGGWSREKVEAWDNAHPKEGVQGRSQTEVATPKGGDGREVFRGVTVSELREAGYSSEQIQRMDMMAARARPRSGGLIETLGAASQANITREDYIHAGFNNQDMATIYKLSQNNR